MERARWSPRLALWLALGLPHCSPSNPAAEAGVDAPPEAAPDASAPDTAADAPSPTVTVRMEFGAADAGFYASPFPSAHRWGPAGLVGDPVPSASSNDYVNNLVTVARDNDGFGTTTGVFFGLTGAVSPASLPDDARGMAASPSVLLVPLEGATRGQRVPATVTWQRDGGPYGAPNMLAIVPVQGVPLAPATLYAAVVLRTVLDAQGRPLDPAPALAALGRGESAGLATDVAATYRAALGTLATLGIATDQLAGLAVYRTGSPASGLARARTQLLGSGSLTVTSTLTRGDTFDGFCVYNAMLQLTGYQAGTPPFSDLGGAWAHDSAGNLVAQRTEQSRLVVTVPRRAMPASGYPLVLFVRTGGGGDRPLVDRGVQAMTGGAAITPGSGPAQEFASVGWAGASWDGPLGGLRNSTMGDEQFLTFNVGNPVALRDNVRQSALEAALLANALLALRFDVSDCAGASVPAGSQARFDPATLTLMGHSMGASIAPLAVAVEPAFRALLLSGSGGSYIANVLYKQHPVRVLPVANALVGYASRSLTADDPALNLFQWAAESSDEAVYGPLVLPGPAGSSPRNVLMMQGIVDHYIMPPIANTSSLSMGLELAGAELDSVTPEVMMLPWISQQLPLVGRRVLTQPVTGNRTMGSSNVTAVLRQYPEDGIEDGHEVVFQRPEPKHDYRCFLQSFASGTPRLPMPGTGSDCN